MVAIQHSRIWSFKWINVFHNWDIQLVTVFGLHNECHDFRNNRLRWLSESSYNTRGSSSCFDEATSGCLLFCFLYVFSFRSYVLPKECWVHTPSRRSHPERWWQSNCTPPRHQSSRRCRYRARWSPSIGRVACGTCLSQFVQFWNKKCGQGIVEAVDKETPQLFGSSSSPSSSTGDSRCCKEKWYSAHTWSH